MGCVGTAPRIRGLTAKFVVDSLDEALGGYGIAVEDDDVLAAGALDTVVAAGTGT